MWMDQGVDVRASDASATQGLDGWGAMCAGLGNLILATAEDAESRFPVLNLAREMTTDTGGAPDAGADNRAPATSSRYWSPFLP